MKIDVFSVLQPPIYSQNSFRYHVALALCRDGDISYRYLTATKAEMHATVSQPARLLLP
jgi:hypothetical protein